MVNRNVSYRHMTLRFSVEVCISRLTDWPTTGNGIPGNHKKRDGIPGAKYSDRYQTQGKFYTSSDSANSTNIVIFEITTVTQKMFLHGYSLLTLNSVSLGCHDSMDDDTDCWVVSCGLGLCWLNCCQVVRILQIIPNCQVEVSLVIIIDIIISLYLFQSIPAGGGFLGKFLLIETQFSEGKHKN